MIFPYALTGVIVGLIESLLCLNFIDNITETRGKANKEWIYQGVSSIATVIFSGLSGCKMIGQSIINISIIGRKYVSSFVASTSMFLLILFGSQYIGLIPMGVLRGLMFVVIIETFAWKLTKFSKHAIKRDVFSMIIVTLVTAFMQNLMLGVGSGMFIAALVFAWNKSTDIPCSKLIDVDVIRYNIKGPLFFGSSKKYI